MYMVTDVDCSLFSPVPSLALLMYELLITFDNEVKFIWPYVFRPNHCIIYSDGFPASSLPRRNVTKWLYFYIRYFGLFAELLAETVLIGK